MYTYYRPVCLAIAPQHWAGFALTYPPHNYNLSHTESNFTEGLWCPCCYLQLGFFLKAQVCNITCWKHDEGEKEDKSLGRVSEWCFHYDGRTLGENFLLQVKFKILYVLYIVFRDFLEKALPPTEWGFEPASDLELAKEGQGNETRS